MTFAALAADWVQERSRKSLFFNVKLNVKGFQIMVDTGATHYFVTEERAKGLCLNYVACDTFLKTANALPTTVHDFAPKVPIDLGVWKRLMCLFYPVSIIFTLAMTEILFWYPYLDTTKQNALVC